MLRHVKRFPTGVGYVLTRVKVHKGVGSLDVASKDDSDDTKGVLGFNGVIAFLGGFYVRYKLFLTMLAEVQTAELMMPLGLMDWDTPSSAAT